jgi:hypothetical protein
VGRVEDGRMSASESSLSMLQVLEASERERLRTELAELMNRQQARIEYAEARRGALATIGGVLLAAGLTGLLPLAKSDWDYFPARLGLLVLVAGFVVTGALVLWLWGRQTNWDYPFKGASQTWKHFYRDALTDADPSSVPWHARLRKDRRAQLQQQFVDGRAGFLERSLTLRDESISLAQDLEQSYLLHWTELYKNRFLTSLRQVVVWGVLVSLTAAVVGFAIAAFVAGDAYETTATDRPAVSTRAGASTQVTRTATSRPK